MDGLIALMNSNYSKPVNIGNPEEYTIMQFAKVIKDAVGKKINYFVSKCLQSLKGSFENYVIG